MRSTRRRGAAGAIRLGAILLVLAGGGAAPPAQAGAGRPLLWQTRGEPHVWVLGTCAVPDARAQALPRGAQEALDGCGAFLTALPASAAGISRVDAEIGKLSALSPELGGLKKVLGAELYVRILPFVPKLPTLESREPWYVHRLLERAHLEAACPQPAPLLTRRLWDGAAGKGLETAGLDTVMEYLESFDTLSLEEQATCLGHTLDLYDKEKETKTTREERTVQAHVAGDVDAIQALWRKALPPGDLRARLERARLDDRVRRMLGRLAARLKRKPAEPVFLAVDAALLAGEHGVLAGLAAAGHDLRRVE
jgi:uncharacterized protein YbaP (TraB family)